MIQNFVPYNESQQLKKLDFSENCLAYYQDWNTKKLLPVDTDFENFRFVSNFLIKAPLYSQAFKFFRERYRLSSHIDLHDKNHLGENYYFKMSDKYYLNRLKKNITQLFNINLD